MFVMLNSTMQQKCFVITRDFFPQMIMMAIPQLTHAEGEICGGCVKSMFYIPDRQDPGGPHVDPMDFAIWDHYCASEPEYHRFG